MDQYLFEGVRFEADSDEGQAILRRAHATKRRPHCPCVGGEGPAMYIAKVGEKFIVKRMPGTGSEHASACESYEPPSELTGLGDVLGSAIQSDLEAGTTTLKLDFALRKIAGKAAPTASGEPADTVRTDGEKLTLRGLLHYLWEEAGMTQWPPKGDVRRAWPNVQSSLVAAAAGKTSKGLKLADRLLIPEPFNSERKGEIAVRRDAHLAAARANPGKDLFILIGELKELAPSRSGFKGTIKHLPDYPVLISDDMNGKLQSRFAAELAIWNAVEQSHLMLIATFSIPAHGFATLQEAAMMVVDSHWLPLENIHDLSLCGALIEGNRKFIKGMRYNLPEKRPMASFVLLDAGERPVALYVVPATADSEYRAALEDLQGSTKAGAWVWETGEGGHPALPARGALL